MSNQKLYRLSESEFSLPLAIKADRTVVTSNAENVPLLFWPDGRWCLHANLYMLRLYHKGLSRRGRGGTLLSYAANLSHLIRFCHLNSTEFIDLTDNQFILFIRSLGTSATTRDNNSIIAIARTCLDFLSVVADFHEDTSFLGPQGRISAFKKESRRSKITTVCWHHRSLPNPSPKKKRLPISSVNSIRLREAISTLPSSTYVRKRRYVLLKLLEVTGARRAEINSLTVASVLEAAAMPKPLLKLVTVKRREAHHRFIPIAMHDLAFLLEFITKNRKAVIRRTCGFSADEGYLLVNENTGRRLSDNTITQEISTLANAAFIEGQVCPHMFRHSFITKLFVALIHQHKIDDKDHFRQLIFDAEALKQQVQQWTGHRSMSSLEPYIHLAFNELGKLSPNLNSVRVSQLLESFLSSLEQTRAEYDPSTEAEELGSKLHSLVESVIKDLKDRP